MHVHTHACAHVQTYPLHASYLHLLTPLHSPPPPPHTYMHMHTHKHMHTHAHTHTHKQTNLQKITPHRYIAQEHALAHTRMHTNTCMHACTHTTTQYICNHEGMIIFPIRYSNIATHKCSLKTQVL